MAPAGFAGSVVTHTVMIAALAAAALRIGLAAWAAGRASLLLRWASAAAIARWLDLPRGGLWLLPLRDALSFAVFLGSFCGRSVLWREQLLPRRAGRTHDASKGTSRYDEDAVSAPAVIRRLRRRRRLALPGAARDPLVLVSDLAGAAGRAGAGQQADRRAAGAAARSTTCCRSRGDYELAVLHTSTPSFASDVKVAEALKDANPRLQDRPGRRQGRGRAGSQPRRRRARSTSSPARSSTSPSRRSPRAGRFADDRRAQLSRRRRRASCTTGRARCSRTWTSCRSSPRSTSATSRSRTTSSAI